MNKFSKLMFIALAFFSVIASASGPFVDGQPLTANDLNNAYNALLATTGTIANNASITNSTINSSTIGATNPSSGAFTTISASGQISSTVATGAAPFLVNSSTPVLNLTTTNLSGGTVSATTISASGGYTQTGTSANTFTGSVTVPALTASGVTSVPNATTSTGAVTAGQLQANTSITASDAGVVNAYAAALSPAVTAYTGGMEVNLQGILNTNTGASTLALNGLAALPVVGPLGAALTGGELASGYGALLKLNKAATQWEIVYTGGTTPVAPATNSNQAVAKSQVLNTIPIVASGSVASATTYSVTSTTFTSPTKGNLLLYCLGWSNANIITGITLTTSLAGYVNQGALPANATAFSSGYLPVTAGQATTFTCTVTTNTAAPIIIYAYGFLLPTP